MADGHVGKQSASYRQGLVLGLTMAELMLLLIFCVLIALAAVLRLEKAQVHATEAAPGPQSISPLDRKVLNALEKNASLYEKAREAATSSNTQAIDEFWRDLVTDQVLAAEPRKAGLSAEQLRKKIAEANALDAKGIEAATAIRDADIVGSIQTIMPKDGSQTNVEAIKRAIQAGLDARNAAGHQWPPIINLSEANGHYFKTGSAELSAEFRLELINKVPQRIVEIIKQYDVDVIEVVGHTDEQPIGNRPSNLDQALVPVLRNNASIGTVVAADNAGLGLARAVSVVSVLRQNKLLQGYKLLPLSGAQLVNTDETLALAGMPGDIRQRRRIEIRLRKSSPYDLPSQITATNDDVPLPPRRPRPMLPKPKPPPPGPEFIFNRPLPLIPN